MCVQMGQKDSFLPFFPCISVSVCIFRWDGLMQLCSPISKAITVMASLGSTMIMYGLTSERGFLSSLWICLEVVGMHDSGNMENSPCVSML